MESVVSAGAGKKLGAFIIDNPGNKVYPLANMGGIVEVGKAHLTLNGYDIGEGTLAIRLIRKDINFIALDRCAAFLECRENCNKQMRSLKKLSKMQDLFHYSFKKSKKAQIMKEVGRMTKSSFLEVSLSDKANDVWMLFHSGARTLSDIIARVGPDYYLDESFQMEDLLKVQQFAAFSRKMAIQRLFCLYYGTSCIEEAAFTVLDFPYHSVDPENSKIYFAARPTNKWALFLCNIRDGAILYQPEPQGSPKIRIGLSGCGKLDIENELYDCAALESLHTSIQGIHCRNTEAYKTVLPKLYQPVDTILISPDSKIILSPIYNYRSDSKPLA